MKRGNRRQLALWSLTLTMLLARVLCGEAAASAPPLPLVPLPRQIAYPATSGHQRKIVLPAVLPIVARDGTERGVATLLQADLAASGVPASLQDTLPGSVAVQLSDGAEDPQLGPEGYRLTIDGAGIRIAANAGAGLFYGVQTFEQLLAAAGASHALPAVQIVDWPQYRWRGIHLDVSRHFFPVPVVERYIDLAARFKLNTFHWHLTDDQGWRLEIKRYPRLTEIGGCRAGSQVGGEGSTQTDGRRYCGWYTQAQIREIVAYARARYVTIVPEIEMPGHAVAAVAAYPWLGCGSARVQVRQLWGISTEIFCPTERTFAFLDDVIGEVAGLFPGTYIHIGGDEVPQDQWRASPFVTALRAREHLTSYDAVQGYFTRRVEGIARKYHRRIIGWDDILDGNISPQAAIMSWHGNDGGIAAAKHGNDAVMTPDPPLYFDAYQGDPDFEPLAIGGLTTLEMVYDYDPMPPDLVPSLRHHILGAQGNVWTEYIPTADHLFYMLLPRELALAELCWTPRSQMNWSDFSQRLGPVLATLESRGYHYRIPLVTFRIDAGQVIFPEQQPVPNQLNLVVTGPTANITLDDVAPSASIYYTLDGTLPSTHAQLYRSPLKLRFLPTQSVTITTIAVLPDGRVSAPSSLEISSATP
ncbi:MAG TPA: family 20 glycosylhydrolase [Candidatus Acidoferrales bacterium]|nr:family 20 glycosylhydrolase [Candidatus Acidoferrales bacterium]